MFVQVIQGQVHDVAGVPAEVLSGEEEALLAFTGAVAAVDVAHPTAVIDIGGGSTELIVGGPQGSVIATVSLQLGCVRLTERHLHSDPPTEAELVAARTEIRARLDEADAGLAGHGVSLWDDVVSLVGVAGTVTTLGALYLGLDHYDETRIHGTHVPAERLGELTVDLTQMTVAQRGALGPVQPGREDVLHGGALILCEVVDRYGVPEVVVSEADGLDGLAASLR
jgi:exopolyphosphatase / guanosine-5'-triphosphate,3'-diphosphate pyrophosphatase